MNINQGFAVDLRQFVVLVIIVVLMIFFDILVLVVQGIFVFLLTVMVLALYVHNFWPKLQLLEFIMLVVLGILMVLLMALDLFFIVVQVSFMIFVVFLDLFLLSELIAFLDNIEAMDQLFELLDRVDFDQVVWPVILQQFIIWKTKFEKRWHLKKVKKSQRFWNNFYVWKNGFLGLKISM